jgi:hypothetical protein
MRSNTMTVNPRLVGGKDTHAPAWQMPPKPLGMFYVVQKDHRTSMNSGQFSQQMSRHRAVYISVLEYSPLITSPTTAF